MEVKIGVLHTPREITLESAQTPDEVSKLVAEALKSVDGQLTLTDEEYQELLEMAYQQGTLARAERDLILQIIRLDRRTAAGQVRLHDRSARAPVMRKKQERNLPMAGGTLRSAHPPR